ncbi:MAG TPA: sugar transferase [Anaerolineaceae bacterium]|nr:sugar transferase [Anaerolineaceae bacterium]
MNQHPGLWRLNRSEQRSILIAGDLFFAYLGMAVSLVLWASRDWLNISFEFFRTRVPGWFLLLPLLWVLLMVELYDLRRASHRREIFKGVAVAAGVSVILYLLVFFLSEPNSLPRLVIAYFIVFCTLLTLLWRLAFARLFSTPIFMRRMLIVGAGRAGSTLAEVYARANPKPFLVVGLVDDDPLKQGTLVAGMPVLSSIDSLLEVIDTQRVTDLVFAISGDMRPEIVETVLKAEEAGIEVHTMPAVYEEMQGRIPVQLLNSDWLLRSFLDEAHMGDFYEFAKRLIDILGALAGLAFFILTYPIISLAILVDSGSPIMYRQVRSGRNGRTYTIIKYRTMIQDAEKDGQPRLTTENDERITRLGNFLRKTHLDEFPQFINVIRGDMSLVGPRAERPEIINDLQRKIPFYRARLLVRPGLTGWAQINQRYAASLEDMIVKLEYDLYYIKHRNLIMDISIILRTFGLRGQ